MAMNGKRFPFGLGADPEFSLVSQGSKLHARDAFCRMFARIVTSGNTQQMAIKGAGSIGLDGHDATAELRPDPADTPQGLARNIGRLLKEVHDAAPFLELRTKSDKGPVGGHMHFQRKNGTGQETIHRLMPTLALCYLPLLLGEDELDLALRRSTQYGKLLDFRAPDRQLGRPRTVEYRAPSAEWMTTPKTATAALSLMAVCWQALTEDRDGAWNGPLARLRSDSGALAALERMTLSGMGSQLRGTAAAVRSAVRKMPAYGYYRDECELAMNPRKMLSLKRRARWDAARGWRLDRGRKRPDRNSLSSADSQRRAAEALGRSRLVRLSPLAAVPYNDDRNVGRYAEALAERIAAQGFKTDRQYFLFGLKRGVPGPIAANHDMELAAGAGLVRTDEDWKVLKLTLERMRKAHIMQKGEPESPKDRILVGIPYDERALDESIDTAPMMLTISDIERGRLKPKAIDPKRLKEGDGPISKAYREAMERQAAADGAARGQAHEIGVMGHAFRVTERQDTTN